MYREEQSLNYLNIKLELYIHDVFPGFTQLLDQEKVKLILSEPTICKVFAKFIADIYEDSLNTKCKGQADLTTLFRPSHPALPCSPNFVNNVSLTCNNVNNYFIYASFL
jgi:hypothetical protein